MRHLDRPDDARGVLDRTMPRWLAAAILVAASIFPTWYVAAHDDRAQGFTSLILFGENFEKHALPEVRALHPATAGPWGYDGQFYAQLALDPTLRRPDLKTAFADESAAYRSQRYLPIVLAYVLGLGHPASILTAYALLNLGFWFALLALLAAYLRGRTARQYAAAVACLLTTGTLISIQRSLTDLPAAFFALASALTEGVAGSLLLSLSMLSKPTGGLLLARYLGSWPADRGEWARRAGLILLALAAPVALQLYILHVFGSVATGQGNLGLPLVGLIREEMANWKQLAEIHSTTPHWDWPIFEFAAPISLLVQASYFAVRREPASPLWWLGATFAALFIFLAHPVLVEQLASTRTVLPLTLAFNLLLARERGRFFWLYFVAGNFGLLWSAYNIYCWCTRGL
jgi:hypothetical protein